MNWFRVELLREDKRETETLLGSYARVLAGRDEGRESGANCRF